MTSSSFTPAATSRSASRSTSAAGARHQVAAQLRDDAERAAIVAAFGNLQIRVVARRQLDAFGRHQVDERVVRRRRRAMHRLDHALVLLRAGDGEHVGEFRGDLLRLRAHAAGDHHLAVLGHRRADGLERLRLRGIEEAAGVDDDEVGARMLARDLVALRAQRREDALGIDQRLRAAERDVGDPRHHVPLRRAGLAQIPVDARHHLQRLARERDGEMLVRRMLRAARIGMRHPDGRKAEAFGEDVVRQRAADIRQHRGLAVGGLGERGRGPARPGMLRDRAASPS